ncbi:MAG: hypothetical protein ACYTGC_00290 [Planctomycetota bacterium]|jgi:hypothetical protein
MAITHESRKASPTQETFLHIAARDFQWALRGACVLLLLATAVFMIVFWPMAIPTVILLVVSYVLLLIADGLEHRTDPHAGSDAARAVASVAAPTELDERTARLDKAHREMIERRVTRIAIEVLTGALILAGALAISSGVSWEMVPIAGLVIVGYIVFVTTPVWLAWMEDDIEKHEGKEGH